MIKLKLDYMLETRGLTAYGLHVKSLDTDENGNVVLDEHGKKKYRLHQSVISKIRHNKSKALQLDILDVLCELLNCQPADLIVYESTTQNVERATQSAKHTQNVITTQDAPTTQIASDNEYNMTTADAAKVLELSPRQVRTYAERGELHGKQGKQSHWFFRNQDVGKFWATRGKE